MSSYLLTLHLDQPPPLFNIFAVVENSMEKTNPHGKLPSPRRSLSPHFFPEHQEQQAKNDGTHNTTEQSTAPRSGGNPASDQTSPLASARGVPMPLKAYGRAQGLTITETPPPFLEPPASATGPSPKAAAKAQAPPLIDPDTDPIWHPGKDKRDYIGLYLVWITDDQTKRQHISHDTTIHDLLLQLGRDPLMPKCVGKSIRLRRTGEEIKLKRHVLTLRALGVVEGDTLEFHDFPA